MHLKHACLPISPPEQMNENEHSILFFVFTRKGVFSLFYKPKLYHLMGQQKREEDHGVLKKRRKANTSPMGEVGGAEKTMLIMPENCV